MSTTAFEFDDGQQRPLRSLPMTALPARARIGCGLALVSAGGAGHLKDNPQHCQSFILLLPLLQNPDPKGYRKPVSNILIERTIEEMQRMFSGYTLTRAMGWYWDETKSAGVSDELVRLEVDGVFAGSDLRELHEWKKKLQRRFRQDCIYMRLVASGVAI